MENSLLEEHTKFKVVVHVFYVKAKQRQERYKRTRYYNLNTFKKCSVIFNKEIVKSTEHRVMINIYENEENVSKLLVTRIREPVNGDSRDRYDPSSTKSERQ